MIAIRAWAIEREPGRVASEQPALWREVRRFNLPVKLALAAAHRAVAALARPAEARLVALAPCRPGSPELRAASRAFDRAFAAGSIARLRANPIHTLHAIDNLALSALSIAIASCAPCVCLGGAAGMAWAALEDAHAAIEAGQADEVLLFGGDQSDRAWRGAPGDDDAIGVAIALASAGEPGPARAGLLAIERDDRAVGDGPPAPHATRGLARWLDALAAACAGRHVHPVGADDGDGVDRLRVIAEVA